MKGTEIDYTFLPNEKKKSVRPLKKSMQRTKKRSRVLAGYAVGLSSLAISFLSFSAFANAEILQSDLHYQALPVLASSSSVTISEKSSESIKKEWTKEEARQYVLSEAKKKGVWVDKIDYMVSVESGYNVTARGDKHIICSYGPNKGKSVNAKGAWQITDCGHPEITETQADDLIWATEWSLNIIATSQKDCRIQWTTCAKWYELIHNRELALN